MSTSIEKLNREIRNFNIYQFLSNFDLARGIFALYLVSKGLSAEQIAILQTTLFVTSLIAEVPTGIFADRFGRKFSMILGLIICACFSVAMIYASTFSICLLLFFLLGLGYSLERGADQALLYSILTVAGEEHRLKYREHMGKARAYRYTSLAIAISIGGLIQSSGWSYVYGAVAILMVAATYFVSKIRDDQVPSSISKTETNEKPPKLLPTLFNLLVDPKKRPLIFLVLAVSFFTAATIPIFIFSQLLFNHYQVHPKYIGLIISASLILNSIASSYSHKVKIRSEIFFSTLISLGLALPIFGLLLSPNIYIAVIIVLLSQTMAPFFVIHFSDSFMVMVPSPIHATAVSIMGLIGAIILSLTNLLIGHLIDSTSISFALGILGFWPIFGLIAIHVFLYKRDSL